MISACNAARSVSAATARFWRTAEHLRCRPELEVVPVRLELFVTVVALEAMLLEALVTPAVAAAAAAAAADEVDLAAAAAEDTTPAGLPLLDELLEEAAPLKMSSCEPTVKTYMNTIIQVMKDTSMHAPSGKPSLELYAGDLGSPAWSRPDTTMLLRSFWFQ